MPLTATTLIDIAMTNPINADIARRLGVSVPRVRQYLAQGIRQCYIALYGEPL